MLQKQPGTTSHQKYSLSCRIENLSYINAQRFSYGIWLWFTLCWRDIFRLLMICIFVDKLCISINTGHRYAIVLLLLPHLLCGLLFVLSNAYQRRQYLQINLKTSTSGDWIFCFFGFFLASILTLGILPSSSYYSMHWGQEYGDVSRLFTDTTVVQPYTMRLLKYILNNTEKEVQKRMAVVNYYITIVFADRISDKCLQPLNYFATMHNSKHGLSNVCWTDIQTAGGYESYRTNARWFRSILTVLIVIYDIALMTVLHQHLTSSVEKIFCWVYVVMDGIWVMFDIKYAQLYWLCHHILPFVDENNLIDDLPWDHTFEDADSMMEDIYTLYRIMFESVGKDTIIASSDIAIHSDIANIIAEYLWCALPIFQRETAAVDDHEATASELDIHDCTGLDHKKEIREFQLQFRALMNSFRDNVNGVPSVCVDTYCSTSTQ